MKENTVRALFYCCTFNLIKIGEDERVLPGMWRIAEHKLQYVHAQLEFTYYASCILAFAARPECKAPAKFPDELSAFFKKMEPASLSSKEVREKIINFLCEKGGLECSAYIMKCVEKEPGTRAEKREEITRSIITGYEYRGPAYMAAKVRSAHTCYLRTLQILWHLNAKVFAGLVKVYVQGVQNP